MDEWVPGGRGVPDKDGRLQTRFPVDEHLLSKENILNLKESRMFIREKNQNRLDIAMRETGSILRT